MCNNEPGTHTDQPASEHTIHTVSVFPLYLQTLNILSTVQYVAQWGKYIQMNSLCLWTGMMMTKKKGKDQNKGENQKDSGKKTSQTSPRFFVATTLTPHPPKSSTEHFSKRSSVTPKQEHRCNTLMTLIGHENQDTLESID